MPDPALYLHLGFHKTGTTVLQRQVFPFLEGVEYLGRPYDARHFIECMGWGRSRAVLVSSETYPGRLLDAYRQDRSYLDEQLAGVARLAATFPHARIIVGIRENSDWVLSCYKHYLKYGGVLALEEFIGLDGHALMRPREFLFAPRLRALHDNFGAANVLVYRQEELRDSPATTIARLCKFTGSVFRGDARLRAENRGLGARGAAVMRRCNATLGGARRLRRLVHDMLVAWQPNDSPLEYKMLPAELREETRKLFARDAQEVAVLLGETSGDIWKAGS